jgi:hypothetical protein
MRCCPMPAVSLLPLGGNWRASGFFDFEPY